MASERLRKLYRRFRAKPASGRVGYAALDAYHAAIIQRKWDALDWVGAVRLRAEVDTDWEPYCECDDPDCANKNPESEAFGAISEHRTDFEFMRDWIPDGGAGNDWETADSVWGNVGYRDVLDPHENGYIIDIMAQTIDAFRDAWKEHVRAQADTRDGRCPACHGTGQTSTHVVASSQIP